MSRILASLVVGLLVGCSGPQTAESQPRNGQTPAVPAVPPVPATPPVPAVAAVPPVPPTSTTSTDLPEPVATPGVVTVYKTPTCGCCGLWVEHLQKNGFQVTAHDLRTTTPARQKYGIPDELASCHTAVVDGYVVEGHIPADIVKKLLAERPPIVGIVVPGMPIGSPGMEGPNPKPYDVLALAKDGTHTVFATVTP